MRYAALVITALGLFTANSAMAQDWGEYVSADERFGINFPGEPEIAEGTFETGSGLSFPASFFTASDAAGSYALTVVRFGDVDDAVRENLIEDTSDKLRAREGEITYDDIAVYDGMDTQMIQITNADGTKSYIAVMQPPEQSGLDRLYIAEGRVSANMPVPGHFQQSLFVVDPNGDRIRYQTDIEGTKFRVIPESGGQPYIAPECAPGLPCLIAEGAEGTDY